MSDNVREVTLTPNSSWGGDGCLGCDIGYGYLHRIPLSVDRSKPTDLSSPLQSIRTGEPLQQPFEHTSHNQTGIPQVDQLINVMCK